MEITLYFFKNGFLFFFLKKILSCKFWCLWWILSGIEKNMNFCWHTIAPKTNFSWSSVSTPCLLSREIKSKKFNSNTLAKRFEICLIKNFRWLFGQWSCKKNCFWECLTFKTTRFNYLLNAKNSFWTKISQTGRS